MQRHVPLEVPDQILAVAEFLEQALLVQDDIHPWIPYLHRHRTSALEFIPVQAIQRHLMLFPIRKLDVDLEKGVVDRPVGGDAILGLAPFLQGTGRHWSTRPRIFDSFLLGVTTAHLTVAAVSPTICAPWAP